jgi:hypothetical protein
MSDDCRSHTGAGIVRVAPPLAPAVELKILRQKYPEGLICTSALTCDHRLIATTRVGYSKSEIKEGQRISFVCAECRQAEAERARVAASKAERARIAAAASKAARAARALDSTDTPPSTVSQLRSQSALKKSGTSSTVLRDGSVPTTEGRAFRSGRPRVDPAIQRRKGADRAAAYRRRKALPTACASA